jgi:hypothetical protein
MWNNHILKDLSSTAPGVVPMLLWAPRSYFETIAMPIANPQGWEDTSIITNNHVFKANPNGPALGFIQIELTDRTGEVEWEETGELDSKGTNGVFTGWAPGLNPKIFGMFGRTIDGIFLFQDSACTTPRYHQFGSSCTPAYKDNFKFTSGKTGGEGRKGTEVKIMTYQERPFIYTGNITLAEQPDDADSE